MNITIRKAEPTDVMALLDIFYKTWLATYPNAEFGITEDDIHHNFKDSFIPEHIEKRAKRIAEMPHNERYYVAVTDNKVIGQCRAILHDDKNQHQSCYVLPEFQGKGIGTMLWNEVKKSFNVKNPTIVHIATYNTNALGFYKKLGFVETGKVFTEERFRMKSGNLIPETELVMTPKGRDRAAGIVIKDGNILLMHRMNKGEEYYVIPGGGIENGETPKETTIREIYEEMSVVVTISKLFHEMVREAGEQDYYYECKYVSGEPALRTDSSEYEKTKTGQQIYEPQWIPFSKIEDILIYPKEVKDKIIQLFVK